MFSVVLAIYQIFHGLFVEYSYFRVSIHFSEPTN